MKLEVLTFDSVKTSKLKSISKDESNQIVDYAFFRYVKCSVLLANEYHHVYCIDIKGQCNNNCSNRLTIVAIILCRGIQRKTSYQ